MAKKIKKMTEKQKKSEDKKKARIQRKRVRQAKRAVNKMARAASSTIGRKETKAAKFFKPFINLVTGLIWHRAEGADEAKQRLAELKEFNVDNQTLKRFKAFRKTFREKYDKDIFSPKLNPSERKEAESIIQSFLSDPESDISQIEVDWAGLKDKNMLGYDDIELEDEEDYISIEQKAKDIDAIKNRVERERISNVMGSPVIKSVWSDVKNNPNDYNVEIMSQAISNISDILEAHEPDDRSTESYRKSMVLEEYQRLMEEGL